MTAQFDEQHDETMAAIVRALETSPAVPVPEDFAARVMARIPQAPRRVTGLQRAHALTPRYGRAAALIAVPVLILAMLFVTRTASSPATVAALQLLLVAQLCAYALWFGVASIRRS